MSSRQRLLKAINHETPDRVPIDLGGNQTGIHKFAYEALLKHLGIAGPDGHHGRRPATRPAVRGRAGAVPRRHPLHCRQGAPAGFQGGIEQNRRNGRLWHDLRDEFGVVWSMPDDQPYYMDISHHPLAEATLADIADYPFPKGDDPSRFDGLRQRALGSGTKRRMRW